MTGPPASPRPAACRRAIALLDYPLPDMTGVQLAEKLRAAFPEMAILIASGRIEGLSEQTLKALGISVFVNKPLPLVPQRQAVLRLARSEPVNRIQQQQHAGGWLAAGFGGTRRGSCATCSAGSRVPRAPWAPPASRVSWPAA